MASFSNTYIFGFAGVICAVCSVAVAGVSVSLSERQQLNKERDTRSSILTALGLPEAEGEEIDKLWTKHVEQRFITPTGDTAEVTEADQNADGQLDDEDLVLALEKADEGKTPSVLGLYVRLDDGETKSIAIPLDGVGLWGPLSGYLAIDPKGTEVMGATFFAPKETPGLGAEIMEQPFKEQWQSKSIVDGDKTETIRVVKGEASTICPDDVEHCVDGVSGATITSRGVDEMVAQALAWYDPYLSDLRGG
ncbi:MAG: NADH:ubiquinone reductase (Na(+)-transporting) subunit C [Myxococcota bacterium]